jgi:hypothetical protein
MSDDGFCCECNKYTHTLAGEFKNLWFMIRKVDRGVFKQDNTHYPHYRYLLKVVLYTGYFFSVLWFLSGIIHFIVFISQQQEYNSSGMRVLFDTDELLTVFLTFIIGAIFAGITYIVTRITVETARILSDISDNLFKIANTSDQPQIPNKKEGAT